MRRAATLILHNSRHRNPVILCTIPGYRLCSPTDVAFASDFLYINTLKVLLELMMGCLGAAQSAAPETGRRWRVRWRPLTPRTLP